VPEGDAVWFAARRLRAALAGQTLTRTDFRVPRLAAADLAGQTVTEVVSRGKHLLVRTDADMTVHTHLKMEGFWRVTPAGPPRRDHRIRLILANEKWQATGYLLGTVGLLHTADESAITGHLGPDLLGPGWDAAEAVRRLRSRPERRIAEALLDQSNLAGIGNLYKSEVLFLSGIHPFRTVGKIPDDTLTRVVELSRRLLDANKDRVDQVTTGDRRSPTWVYGRRGRLCRRCGTRLETDSGTASVTDPEATRVTFWCPRCQPE
jgi:endonuclease-8